MQKNKAQIATETLFAIGIVMLIFILLIPININKRNEIRDTGIFLEKLQDCRTFVNSVSRASTENLEITFSVKNNLTQKADSKTIDSGGVLCNSLVSFSEDISLNKGNVRIKNINGNFKKT